MYEHARNLFLKIADSPAKLISTSELKPVSSELMDESESGVNAVVKSSKKQLVAQVAATGAIVGGSVRVGLVALVLGHHKDKTGKDVLGYV